MSDILDHLSLTESQAQRDRITTLPIPIRVGKNVYAHFQLTPLVASITEGYFCNEHKKILSRGWLIQWKNTRFVKFSFKESRFETRRRMFFSGAIT